MSSYNPPIVGKVGFAQVFQRGWFSAFVVIPRKKLLMN